MAGPSKFENMWVNQPISNSYGPPAGAPVMGAYKDLALHVRKEGKPNVVVWAYRNLLYNPGDTTVCPHVANGILTGWMSGCFVFKFTIAGTLHIAHVGTDDQDAAKNRSAKLAWYDLVDNTIDAGSIYGIDPSEAMRSKLPGFSKTVMPMTACWITWRGDVRTIVIGRPHKPSTDAQLAGWYKIVDYRHQSWKSWNDLQNAPKLARPV